MIIKLNRGDVIFAYLNGSKYKKAAQWYSSSFEKYAPHIIAHKTDDKKLYCTITKLILNKIPEEIESHMEGKRYKRLLKEQQLNNKASKEKSNILIEKELENEEEDDN